MKAAMAELIPVVGVKAACHALAVPRASFYRSKAPVARPVTLRVVPRALSPGERESVMALPS